MIDIAHISEEVIFEAEGNGGGYSFSTVKDIRSRLPNESQLNQKIRSIVLAKSRDFIYQEIDIMPLQKAFMIGSMGFIRRAPSDLKILTHKDFSVLKYSSERIPEGMFEIAKKCGMACYWDCETLIFCATKDYQPIIQNIYRLLKSHNVRIELDPRFPYYDDNDRDLWIWKKDSKNFLDF